MTKRTFIIIGAALLVIAAAVYSAFFDGKNQIPEEEPEEYQEEEEEPQPEPEEDPQPEPEIIADNGTEE